MTAVIPPTEGGSGSFLSSLSSLFLPTVYAEEPAKGDEEKEEGDDKEEGGDKEGGGDEEEKEDGDEKEDGGEEEEEEDEPEDSCAAPKLFKKLV
ncbi:MAG: hypothetical protein TREMPRED_003818 [Tremellales sp. Tagirdzhanova-0007]|nr:MAG: hypothetical protein TREMPRED_003818 [Tremellales sp. Tagirdzhanova-0007]